MVREGCTEILCFVTQFQNEPKYSNYRFDHELVERCSSAFRNLSISIPNQAKMVEAGAIECIVSLITLNGESLDAPDFVMTRRNCASALRSMTYNTAIRLQLVQSGAIKIILQDLKRNFAPGELQMNMELLCELEAESWCNGSRGQQKESRAAFIESAPMYTRLLGGISNVHLNIDMKSADRKKYLVKVNLQEPPIETSGARQALEDGFQTLVSFGEDDTITTAAMEYPKIDLPTEETSVAFVPLHLMSQNQNDVSFGQKAGVNKMPELHEIDDDDTTGNEHRNDIQTPNTKPGTDQMSNSMVSSVYSSSHDTVGSKGNIPSSVFLIDFSFPSPQSP
jgi:hypothetical protein